MIAQVTDCAVGIGAVRTRRPFGSVSRRKVATPPMLARPVVLAIDEPDGLPRPVDRCALVVDEPGCETDSLHRVEVKIGLELRCLLRPRDPEAVRRTERALQAVEAALELGLRRGEKDEDVRPGLRAELLRQRSRGVVLLSHASQALKSAKDSL